MLKVKVVLSVSIALLLSACAESRMQCVGTGSFATLAEKLCPQVAGVKSEILESSMSIEDREAHAYVRERNGRIVHEEAGLQQTFWK